MFLFKQLSLLRLLLLLTLIKSLASLSYEFMSKLNSTNLNSNDPDKCTFTTNKFYMIWLCENTIGFIANTYFKQINNTNHILLFDGKISAIYVLGNYTYLLNAIDHRIAMIINDDSDKFEKFYIDLSEFFVKKSVTYHKFMAVKNGDFITFSLLINEKNSNSSYVVVFSIVDFYPIVKRDKNLMIYDKQIIAFDRLNNFFMRKNVRFGYLNLFLVTNESLEFYETGFENLNFQWKKSFVFEKPFEESIIEAVFYENLLVLKVSNNKLMIFKHFDDKDELVNICDILLENVKNITQITINKNPISFFSSFEYNLAFIDQSTNKLFIYGVFVPDSFFLKSLCYEKIEEINNLFENIEFLEYFQIEHHSESKIFRYLLVKSLFLDTLKTFALIPYCFTNELNQEGCLKCSDLSYNTNLQGNFCDKTCQTNSNTNENINESNTYDINKNDLNIKNSNIDESPIKESNRKEANQNSLSFFSNYLSLLYCPTTIPCHSQMQQFLSPSHNLSHLTYYLSPSNFCEFDCKDNSRIFEGDKCLKRAEAILYEDYCQKFSDCYNCSIAYDCLWCENQCQNVKLATACDFLIELKSSDNLWKFERCERLDLCGKKHLYFESEGDITLHLVNNNTFIKKNTFCSWEIFTFKGAMSEYVYYNVLLSIDSGFLLDKIDPLSPRMSFCLFTKENPNCFTWPLFLNFSNFTLSYRVYFKRFKITLFFPEERTINTQKFAIKFQKQQEYLMDFTALFSEWIFISLLSIVFMICCILLLRSISFSIRREGNMPLLRRLEFELYNFENPKNRLKRLLKDKIISKEKFDGKSNNFSQEECPFCLEKFVVEEELARCHCKHIFHYSCMEQWNKVEKRSVLQCPLCKEELEKKKNEVGEQNIDL